MRLRVAAVLFASLAMASPTFAQVTGAVKGGVNFAKVNFEDEAADATASTDMRAGLVVGAAIDVPIAPMFSFQPEVLYTQKGGKNGDISDGITDVTLKVDMIQIPLLAKVGATAGSVRPFVVAGPAIGFVTSAKFSVEGFDDDEDIKDDLEKVEFSGIIGGGVQFGRGIVEARYDHGFRDMEKEIGAASKTRTISILFGYSFP